MIDFHTHILPGIDDGSRDAAESLAMLREEQRQGVQRIVLTPHFYADRHTVEDFIRRREESVQRLVRALKEAVQADPEFRFPTMKIGAEVYFFPGMGLAEKLPSLCIRGTDLILVEMPFAQWDELVLLNLEDILVKQGLRVVLAHVERYPEFQKDWNAWERVLEMTRTHALTLQINAGGISRSRGGRKFCLRLLEEYDHVIMGSDCHNMTSRVPNLLEARRVIEKKLGRARLDLLDQTAAELLG